MWLMADSVSAYDVVLPKHGLCMSLSLLWGLGVWCDLSGVTLGRAAPRQAEARVLGYWIKCKCHVMGPRYAGD